MGERSFSIRDRSRWGYQQGRVWVHIVLVIALVMTQLVFVSGSAQAGHEVTGMGEETASLTSRLEFNTFESPEVQWVWNDTDPDEIQNITHNHTAGTFTLSFDGEGPTGPIPYNDDGSTIKSELEAFAGITTVDVTENAVGDWDVEFVNPGESDVPLMTGDPTLLSGGDSFTIDPVREGGPGGTFTLTFGNETTAAIDWDASDVQVETALKDLVKLDEVTVSGSGSAGDEWIVTFPYAVPELTKTDSLLNGTTSISTVTPGTSAPIDPSGLTWVGASLVLADSEIEEEETVYDDVNMWTLTTAPSFLGTGKFEHGSAEPTGLAYNPAGNGHLYISNDNSDRVYDVDLGANGSFDSSDTFTCVDTTLFGVLDPEDVAWDAELDQLFVASGIGGQFDNYPRTVTSISPGADGTLGSSPNDCLLGADDVAGSPMDFSATINDLEGLEYRAASDTLLLIDPTNCMGACEERIIEATKDGRIIRTITISETRAPSDAAIASNGTTLYMVDRGRDNNSMEPPPRDGEWFEYEVDFHNLAPFVEAGTNQTVDFGDAASLVGDSYDDGQGSNYSSPPFVPDVTWSKVSGPGAVNFTAPNSLITDATFSRAGDYLLKLASDDGDNTSEDMVGVTVNPAAGGGGGGGGGGGSEPIVTPNTFVDDDDSIFEQDIEWMAAEGITNGCAPARFCPDAEVTRGQLAAFLVRALGLTAGEGANLFIDDDGHFFESEIDRLATAGITKGCAPQRFCPDDPVTRAEVAAMLVRALNLTSGGGSDLFIDDDGHQFEIHINRIGEAGITKGCGPQLFCPDDSPTRGEIAAFLHRALG